MSEIVIRQSVFDRLIGADLLYEGAGDAGRPPRNSDESIMLLKKNLLRDLEWLLNARQISDAAEITQENLSSSVYTFGIPERVGQIVAEVNRLALDIQQAAMQLHTL